MPASTLYANAGKHIARQNNDMGILQLEAINRTMMNGPEDSDISSQMPFHIICQPRCATGLGFVSLGVMQVSVKI